MARFALLDSDGRPQFNDLLFGRGDPVYVVFDLLFYEREDIRSLPLKERRVILDQVAKRYGFQIFTPTPRTPIIPIFLAQPNPKTINDPDRLLDYYDAELQAKSPRRKTVTEILATGTILQEAKRRLPHGHFGLLVVKRDMERSEAARLMKIARCFSNVDNVYICQLPASTITLYTMTKLKREVLEAKLRSGEFNTRTTCEQVQTLLPQPKSKQPPSRLNQLRRFMSKHREAMELEFADNPVLERTIPREMLEIIEGAKERRRRQGKWAGRTAAITTAARFLRLDLYCRVGRDGRYVQ